MAEITVKRTTFKGRKGMRIQNDLIQLVMLQGGGHIADISFKDDKFNPLWIPKWESIEPDTFSPEKSDRDYGGEGDARLLCGIMGHNICLDFFGVPSEEELAKGITTHGEAPVLRWGLSGDDDVLTGKASLPEAGFEFTRVVQMQPGSRIIRISETIENTRDEARKFGWCQHVTFGEPFLIKGETVFDMPAVWGRSYSSDFGDHLRLEPDRDFIWPTAPAANGKNVNLRFVPSEEKSGDFTTQLMDPALKQSWFTAYSPDQDLLVGYVWDREDFPWIGNWEENFARDASPWDGKELTRGMEFSTSPFPEGRDAAVEKGSLRKTPTFRTVEPGGTVNVSYIAFIERGIEGYQGTDELSYNDGTVAIRSQNKTVEIS